jgi:hypothetical protein
LHCVSDSSSKIRTLRVHSEKSIEKKFIDFPEDTTGKSKTKGENHDKKYIITHMPSYRKILDNEIANKRETYSIGKMQQIVPPIVFFIKSKFGTEDKRSRRKRHKNHRDERRYKNTKLLLESYEEKE